MHNVSCVGVLTLGKPQVSPAHFLKMGEQPVPVYTVRINSQTWFGLTRMVMQWSGLKKTILLLKRWQSANCAKSFAIKYNSKLCTNHLTEMTNTVNLIDNCLQQV